MPAKLLQNKKRVVAFVGFLFFGSLLLSGLNAFLRPATAFLLQTAGFFGLGYLHFLIVRANVFGLTENEKLSYSFSLATVIGLAGAVFYFFAPAAFTPQTFLTGACAFLLPVVLDGAWRLFHSLSTRAAATWRYSTDVSLQKATTFLNSMPVRFKIMAGQFGGEYTVSFRAPVRMKLGTIFYHMVQEQNSHDEEAIRLLDREGEPYEWAFSTSVFGWKNFLDPELTLLENGIKENAVVTAQRISERNTVEAIQMENS